MRPEAAARPAALNTSAPTPAPDDTALAECVIAWQRQHGRHDLPWQRTRDPYRVWLSEVMLQQTQVATVLGYYARFMAQFPDVQSLAAAPLDEVLALWSGLGYYSRARNLHRCAQAVVQQHDGRFPPSAQALATLPGIGRSTAAAIAAFCFGERAAILDGNVKRVLTRALGFDADLSQAAAERALWARAEALLPPRDVEVYTQGLMDLGATVCTLRRPDCARCPLQPQCVAAAQGQPQRYPVKTRRTRRGRRAHALLWLAQGDTLLLWQRPPRGVWAGLWSLPEFEDAAALQALSAGWPGQGAWLPAVEHALTHFDWTLRPLRWTLPASCAPAERDALLARIAAPAEGTLRWCTRAQALALGLPAPVRRLLEQP
jgi:A/G-specific adenine glycosylase